MRLTTYLSAAFAFLPVVLTLQECYVCLWRAESGSPELEHQFPEERLPVCQRGNLPPPKQCPPRYKGCLTQYSGELVQRSCGELNLTICQQANDIDYCYCEGNLCNGKERDLPKTTTAEPDTTSDDEDDDGGSGHGSEYDGMKREPSLKSGKPTISASPVDSNQLEKSEVRSTTGNLRPVAALTASTTLLLAFSFAI